MISFRRPTDAPHIATPFGWRFSCAYACARVRHFSFFAFTSSPTGVNALTVSA